MSGDIRTFRNIYATNSFCLRDETSCDEDKGVNPHNPGGGRGGEGGENVYKVTLRVTDVF